MDDLSYTMQKRAKRDTKTTNVWLRTVGINVKSFAETKPIVLNAQKVTELLLAQHRAQLDKATIKFLKYFRIRYKDGKKRIHITDGDCYRVLNLSNRIKRGEYKSNTRTKK